MIENYFCNYSQLYNFSELYTRMQIRIDYFEYSVEIDYFVAAYINI